MRVSLFTFIVLILTWQSSSFCKIGSGGETEVQNLSRVETEKAPAENIQETEIKAKIDKEVFGTVGDCRIFQEKEKKSSTLKSVSKEKQGKVNKNLLLQKKCIEKQGKVEHDDLPANSLKKGSGKFGGQNE